MRSSTPKPLHTVAGIPMVERVLRAGMAASPAETAIVVSPDTASIVDQLPGAANIHFVMQNPPRGTGDAVLRALDALPHTDRVVVLYSDHPLLNPHTVRQLVAGARASEAMVTILSALLPDPGGYGRVERDGAGRVTRIVERNDDDPLLRTGITEINSGMMVLDARWARGALANLSPSTATGELYLTELVAVATRETKAGAPWPVAAIAGAADDAVGVNDRIDLAYAESRAWQRKRDRIMHSGVTMRLPETSIIDEDVDIGPDTVILPYTELLGTTTIGSGCILGPAAIVIDSHLADRVIVRSSTIEQCRVAEETDIGPYAHLRAGSDIGPRVHIGNFAELKNARLSTGVKVGHFSYIGDADIGAGANVGAGTVTANYDGSQKHHTHIGARAFIGSDTILRAPIHIGSDARTGAGSVVTKDVPDGATVVGVPARIVRRTRTEPVEGAEEV